MTASAGNQILIDSTGSFTNTGAMTVTGSGSLLRLGATNNATTFDNQGTIDALAGSTLQIYGDWTDSGTVTVDNSTLQIYSNVTTAEVEAIDLTGTSTLSFYGTMDNSSDVLDLDTFGPLHMTGGTISSGTLHFATPGDLTFRTGNGNFDAVFSNVAVQGDVVLDGSSERVIFSNNAYVVDADGSSTGSITFSTAATGMIVRYAGTQTLSNTTVNFDGTPTYYWQGSTLQFGGAASETLTLDTDFTIQGGDGYIGYGASANVTIDNGGSILANAVGGGNLMILSGTASTTWINSGFMTASLGNEIRIESSGTFTNSASGMMEVNSGVILASNTLYNSGTITLTNTVFGDSADFYVTNGSLVNYGSGTLQTLAGGGGGSRSIYAQLDNQGNLLIDHATTLDDSGATHVNSSTITVQENFTIMLTGGATFTNQSGGLFDIKSAFDNGHLTLDGAGTFTNALGAIFNGSGDITQLNGAQFDNFGSLNPGTSPGIMTFSGDFVQGYSGVLNMELGGTVAGSEYDQLIVSGQFELGGTLNVLSWNGFSASEGDSFDVATAGSFAGQFDDYDGLNLGGGLVLDPIFDSDTLTLLARDTGATDGDDLLTGTDGYNTIDGLDGEDVIIGGADNDDLIGGAGQDMVSYDTGDVLNGVVVDLAAGTASNDGYGSRDQLTGFENVAGSKFADSLTGDAGANALWGLAGVDVLTGGAGADSFNYQHASDGGDIISDFQSGIDALGFDAAEFVAANSDGVLDEGAFIDLSNATYDGSNVGGEGGAWDAGEGSFIYDETGTLYYDDNGIGEGYTVIATVNGDAVSYSDIQLG